MADKGFKLNIDIKGFQGKLQRHLIKTMNEVMVRVVGFVKTNFGPSNQKGKNPSRPGSAPNIGTGTLRNSITFRVDVEGADVLGTYGVRKGPADEYGKRLELGFVGLDSLGRNYNQQPRPFLKPAYRKNKRKIVKILGGKK